MKGTDSRSFQLQAWVSTSSNAWKVPTTARLSPIQLHSNLAVRRTTARPSTNRIGTTLHPLFHSHGLRILVITPSGESSDETAGVWFAADSEWPMIASAASLPLISI